MSGASICRPLFRARRFDRYEEHVYAAGNVVETSVPKFDPVSLLVTRWKTVVLCVALGGIGGLAYGFIAPKWYAATLTVVPSQRSQSSITAVLASKLPDSLDPTTTDAQRIVAVLNSASVADRVIDKFKLADVYDSTHPEHTREKLHQHCTVEAEKKSSVVTLTCEDQDPSRAMNMAAYFGEVGNEVFRRISATSAQEESRFLESQVTKAKKDVDDASHKLRDFQETHKVIDLPEQSKAVISAMASVRGELMTKQLSLQYLTSFSSATESSVIQLRQQISILENQLKDLEDTRQKSDVKSNGSGSAGSGAAGSGASPADPDFFPGAGNVPQLRQQLEDLMREEKIAETVFFLLTQRFEMAKVDAARDTSTFQILDQPTMPTYKTRPKRAKTALIGALIGTLLAALALVGPAWFRHMRLKFA